MQAEQQRSMGSLENLGSSQNIGKSHSLFVCLLKDRSALLFDFRNMSQIKFSAVDIIHVNLLFQTVYSFQVVVVINFLWEWVPLHNLLE